MQRNISPIRSLIGQREQLIQHTKAEGLGGLEVEVELEFCRLLQLKPSA